MIDIVELNIILYYADFLSLQNSNTTVTDNCKYYYIYGSPMNAAYIANTQPFYDENDKFYKKSLDEYTLLKNKFGKDGALSFINEICNLAAIGCVNANQMLKCIHRYSSKFDRKDAIRQYEKWLNSQIYTHIVINEKGDIHRERCSRYVAHAECGTDTKPEVSYTYRSTKK